MKFELGAGWVQGGEEQDSGGSSSRISGKPVLGQEISKFHGLVKEKQDKECVVFKLQRGLCKYEDLRP